MATIGNVVVKIAADTRQFVSNIRKSRTTLAKLRTGITAASDALHRFGAVAGAAALAGISSMVKRELELIDSTVKLSKVLGSTVADLEAVRLAAQLGGSDVGQLDKGLKNLNKTIGETKAGLSTEGTKAFGLLGVDLEKLTRGGTVQAFVQISEALAKINDLTVRAGIANKIFGRPGRELLITMQELAVGFRDVRREAVAFGLDTGDLVGTRVQNLNDDIVRLTTSLRGLVRVAAELFSNLGVGRLTERISSVTIGLRDILGLDTKRQTAAFKATFGREPEPLSNVIRPFGFLSRGNKISEVEQQKQTRLLERLLENSRITGTTP